MNINLNNNWKSHLKTTLNASYFKTLQDFVTEAYNTKTCFPPEAEIFSAFNYCDFDAVKVVILGQDPYHGKGQANGLSFSVNDGVKHPPSLINIFKELASDLDIEIPTSGNLEHWASQGVLLLNATLTVEESNAGSHQKQGWETFTDAVIQTISKEKKGVIFLLWGGYAKKKAKLINKNDHYILESGHPSPLSANRGYWFGNKHFSKANTILEKNGLTPIKW